MLQLATTEGLVKAEDGEDGTLELNPGPSLGWQVSKHLGHHLLISQAHCQVQKQSQWNHSARSQQIYFHICKIL